MIGDVPKGAPVRCRLGKHTGQERGGLMVFQCPRCGGSFWQTDPKYRAALASVELLEKTEQWDRHAEIAQAGSADAMVRKLEES